ncbi:hypothetical protein N0V94_004285 [Neodidymelliopsis sp. IMI 364377]|nr:hypothetical protein N0V94_004285 [Neodidymelliopsis sp. IMI 364377]
MTGPIDFSFAVELARERREAAKNQEVDAYREAETRRQEEEVAQRRRALNEVHTSSRGVGASVYRETTGSTPAAATAELYPVRSSLGRWRKAREFFRPDLRRKRKTAKKIPSGEVKGVVNPPAVEAPALPGSDLLRIRGQPEIPSLPISDINDEVDADDMEITAFPRLPTHYIPTGSPLFPDDSTSELAQAQEEADKQLEKSFEAWEDVKGKRVSTHVPLPTEWSASKLEAQKAVSVGARQQRLPTYSAFPRVRKTPASDVRPRTASSQLMEEILDEVTRTERVWSKKDAEDGNDSDDNIFPALWAI